MAKFTYPYTPFSLPPSPPYPKGMTVYRPWIAATVTASNGNRIRCYTLPDTTYYDTVSVDLGDDLRFDTYAGFTQGMDAQGIGLLGQCGFFDSYNVEFRHGDKIFTIETK